MIVGEFSSPTCRNFFDELLVAQVVRDICVGKTISFVGGGEFEAKGFEQPVPLFEVAWEDI